MEQNILKQASVTKEKIPERIANAPEITLGLELYMNAFYALTSCRGSLYASEGPIPWLAMRDYCEDFDIRGEDRRIFIYLMTALDQTYLKYKAKKTEARTK